MFDSVIQLQHGFLCEYLNYVQIHSVNSSHLTPRVAEGTCQTNTKQNILTPIIAGELKDRGNSLSRIVSSSGHFVHFLCLTTTSEDLFSSPYIQEMCIYLCSLQPGTPLKMCNIAQVIWSSHFSTNLSLIINWHMSSYSTLLMIS